MITLEEKKLQAYKRKLLSFEKGEHKSQEVLDINPRGQVNKPVSTVLYVFTSVEELLNKTMTSWKVMGHWIENVKLKGLVSMAVINENYFYSSFALN